MCLVGILAQKSSPEVGLIFFSRFLAVREVVFVAPGS